MLEINNDNNNKNKNRSRMQNKVFLSLIVTVTFLFLLVNSELNFVEVYSQEEKQQQESSNSSIVLTAKLIDDEYRWIDSNNNINPTLNMTSEVDNQITINSLKGDTEEHEIVIEGASDAGGKGEELIASDEIEDGSSTAINFNPEDDQDKNYQSFEYYCEYHPDTMRGQVQIIK
jgi:hypothetical protein